MASTGDPGERPAALAPRSARLHAVLAGLAIGLATLAAYVPAMQAGFVWDDDYYVTRNAFLKSGEGLARVWLEPGAALQYYPMIHTMLWLEYRLWGPDPAGYHVVNIALHALSALLLWRLLARLGLRGAWLAATLFALHPVHVESVAWVTERKNVLSGVFYLSAALAYLRFAPLPEPGGEERPRDWRFYPLSLVLFLLALLSKTVTASFPAAALLVVWWKTGRLRWRDTAPLLPMAAAGTALGLLTVWMEKHFVGASGAEWSLGLVERCIVAGRAVWFYAAKLVWPQPLLFVYPRWNVSGVDWQIVFPIAAAALVAGLWLERARIGRGPVAAVLFFGGTLFPALGFLDVYPHRFSFVADHFQYLASIGLLALVANGVVRGIGRCSARWALPARALVALWLVTLAALVWRQARTYESKETLFGHVIAHNPDSYLAHTQLGNVYFARGDFSRALRHYDEALRVQPDVISANNVAWALATSPDPRLRDGRRAVELAERAVELTQHRIPGMLDTLAAAYAEVGRYRDAVRASRQAIALARAAGDTEQERQLVERMRLYQARRPYRGGGG